jgi:hypothetical protein
LHGFASGLSFQDKEQILNQAENEGLTLRVADDCSGWDLGVKLENDAFTYFVKRLIDMSIVHNGDESLIWLHWCSRWHKVNAMHRNKDGSLNQLGFVWILDQMFSGMTITLLKNTFNNVFLKRFVIEGILKIKHYRLMCSGDDSESLLPSNLDKDVVRKAFLTIGTLDPPSMED